MQISTVMAMSCSPKGPAFDFSAPFRDDVGHMFLIRREQIMQTKFLSDVGSNIFIQLY